MHERTVRRRLDAYELPPCAPEPRIMNAMKVGLVWVFAVRDPHRDETMYAHETAHESTASYQMAYAQLCSLTEGRGVPNLEFSNYAVVPRNV